MKDEIQKSNKDYKSHFHYPSVLRIDKLVQVFNHKITVQLAALAKGRFRKKN